MCKKVRNKSQHNIYYKQLHIFTKGPLNFNIIIMYNYVGLMYIVKKMKKNKI